MPRKKKRLEFRSKRCEWRTECVETWKWPKHWEESKIIRRYTDISTYIPITSTRHPVWMIAICPLTSQIYRCFLPRFCPNLFRSHAVLQVRYWAALHTRGPTWVVLFLYLKEPNRFWIGHIKWWFSIRDECLKISIVFLLSVAFIHFKICVLFVILQFFVYLYVKLLNYVNKGNACSVDLLFAYLVAGSSATGFSFHFVFVLPW